MRQIIGSLLVIAGLAAVGASVAGWIASDASFGSKYTPDGRDGNALLLLFLIGIGSAIAGMVEVILGSTKRDESNGADTDEPS